MQAIELATTISDQGGIALPAHFKALYGRDARMILLIDDDVVLAAPTPDRQQRQQHVREGLAAVAQAGTFAQIDDTGAWQREIRADRPQPGPAD